ncbi:hypothetical protein [Glaciecola sp. MF2-115]|uniref:hypothetical protein n=1 Tax=Glaciecola sp. MF2-115 TaxID=3384827 RepID=UPI0039A0711C
MQQSAQIQVQGIGQANVLAIAKHHELLGLSKRSCIELILNAPSIFKTKLNRETAVRLSSALEDVGLPCRVLDQTNPNLNASANVETTQDKYEIAAYINDFSAITEFASKIAAFTGQSGEEVIKSLCNTPATLLGNLSETVANELAERFSIEGVDVLVSCPKKAKYTLVAFALDDLQSVQQYYAQLGMTRERSKEGLMQWQAQNIDFDKAYGAWRKANEFHLPIVLQNHDYMRFDVRLLPTEQSNTATLNIEMLTPILADMCGIPAVVHEKLLANLPMLIARCIDWDRTQELLAQLHQCGVNAEANLISSNRFDLSFPNWEESYAGLLTQLCQTIMGKQIPIKISKNQSLLLPVNANSHQALWLQYECKRSNIHCLLSRR